MHPPQPGRLPGLDGLRALAISLTIWMHLIYSGVYTTERPLWLGRQGVCLFFALSGYLITLSLFRDSNLRHFYWKRAVRIFPSFYLYLAVILGLCGLGFYQRSTTAILAAATYGMNWYAGSRGWPLEHTWSLAVEEQFYLVWPLLLATLGQARAALAILSLLVCWPLQRWLRHGRAGHLDHADALFSATYDTILWGCLAALLQKTHPGRARALCAPPLILAVLALLSSVYSTSIWPVALIPPLRGLALAWLILWVSENPDNILVRILELPPLRWVGRRSYSIYLWHILFCDPRVLHSIGTWGALATILAVAGLNYAFLETRTVRNMRNS